ncbi:hypothetical protein FNV43_RR15901 [Rhamnella rubrinervis]|uniref:Glycosyltransferase n=1 Tax=Rhamnella rubrinervis TaxID=2594499 RepID=A0A8K0GYE6_9ROSA|nr:hypothetical protein FNV43_RR15901 [Rhamnella rubrinervis]
MANQADHHDDDPVVVVLVPLPMQGHLNQLLHLSRLLLSYNNIISSVHFVGTATHNRQAKLRVHGWDPTSFADHIHFHDLSVPPFLSPLPNPNQPTTNFPCHLQPTFEATSHLRKPFAALIRQLSSKARRVVVIHDSLMASVVQDVASIADNAESYIFHSVSAFTIFLYFWDSMRKSEAAGINAGSINHIPYDEIPSLEGCFSHEFLDFIASQYDYQKFKSGSVFNTSRVIEKPFMDLLDNIRLKKKNWAIGPFNPVPLMDKKVVTSERARHKCLEWLDKQPPRSVIYVSFGTTTALTNEQIKQLAYGLEQSKQKFIWVLRDADKGDVFDGEVRQVELPKGYEERVKSMGIVVRDWAPQLEILGHPSTGGFMTHCGWNSCMESITMGVPVAAWPMHSDQPRNTVLITKLLKIGIVVKEWARRDEIVTACMVASGLKKLMMSDEMRKRAADLGAAVRKSMAHGGASRLELDSFIAHITR